MGPISIEEVLAEEAAAISGSPLNRTADAQASGQRSETQRDRKDADQRELTDEKPDDVEKRKAFYRALNKRDRAALCCSGGGIRSATFCLGVIQALADYDVNSTLPPSPPPAAGASGTSTAGPAVPRKVNPATKPEDSLLGRFHFLSTVSGGGYVGSWLSAWRMRDGFPEVWRNLTSRPEGPDVEPPEISWLRAYSNYLTPKTGLVSADTWTGIAIYLRNLLLNWLIIIPAICIALLGLKMVATLAVGIARAQDNWLFLDIVGLVGIAFLIVAQAFTTAHRPTRRGPRDGNVDQPAFLGRDLAFSLASAFAVTTFFTSRFGEHWVDATGVYTVMAILAVASVPVFAAGWLAGRPVNSGCGDFIRWAGSGLVYGALIGLGAYLFTLLQPYSNHQASLSADALNAMTEAARKTALAAQAALENRQIWTLLLPMIFGVPWVLMSQLMAEMIFVGLTSHEPDSDSDREWLGRAAGWVAASAVGWTIVAFLSMAGGHFVLKYLPYVGPWLGSLGGITGIATALLGKSAHTQATPNNKEPDTKAKVLDIALKLAGPVFAAVLTVALSIGLDKILLGGSLVETLRAMSIPTLEILLWLAIGLGVLVGVEWLASRTVNINRFSLHAVYRNRLIRGYLGATRQERHPDKFTGFDGQDNICVHELWPKPGTAAQSPYGLFHVINIALNVVSTKRLAWQERKAESFTVSPLHSGAAFKGFRSSEEYGDYPGKGGISLGTAMAISGAAASPNMGYHSSPSITLLLALFNVRLGWWLGNPGKEGETSYQSDGPRLAFVPLLQETFGQTTDDRAYVYLSDGGHFENLGLYEMVRRRCRFIVAIDAGCDPDFAFEDLGNAVRKIFIDLGIRVRFDELQTLRNRNSEKAIACDRKASDPQGKSIPYYTIGTIDYLAADGNEAGCGNGYILYIKPAYHGTEGAGIRSYASAHPTFPHESTGDQWFTESQFESYRSLGLDIMNNVLRGGDDESDRRKLADILVELAKRKLP